MNDHSWLSTKEASILLGVSQRTIQNWVDSGKIKSTRTMGGHRRLNRDNVKTLLEGKVEPELLETSVDNLSANESNASLLRILIVEDDFAILRLCQLQFAQFSVPHQLFLANNAFQGLIMAGKHQPHLIFTDLKMPEIDGLRMINEIMKLPEFKDTKFIAVTGLETREIIQMGDLPEGLIVLPKPIPFKTVETILFQHATHLATIGKNIRRYMNLCG